MMTIVYAAAVLGGLGLVFGILLAVAGKVFYVPADWRVTAVLGSLPGANCGCRGYPGCKSFARALIEGEAPANACSAGGQELAGTLEAMLERF